MKFGISLLLLVFVGCATNQPDATPEQSASHQVDVTWTQIKPDTVIPGNIYNFDDSENKYSIDAQTLEKVKTIVRKKMAELGYQEVKTLRKAYVSVFIVADWEKLADDNASSVETTETRMQNGKIVSQFTTKAKRLARFTIAMFTNSYGKRSSEVSRLFLKVPAEEWRGYEDQLLSSIERDFHGIMKAAPSSNQKMAGDPGCMPRFGYISDRETEKVTKIWRKSPAERAGIKVGDQILAIDSMPINQSVEDNKMYEDGEKVPVKYKRGDKILRAQMQAALMCD